MSTTLPDILQARNLLGNAEQVKAGLPIKHLPATFLGGPGVTRPTEGNVFTHTITSGAQKTARYTAYGAPSSGRTMSGIGERSGKTITSSENVDIKASTLMNLVSPSGQRQRLGESEVARLNAEAVTLRMNLRIAAVTQALFLGNIYFDIEGNLLPSSSSAVVTVAMPTPTTYTKSASWQTAGTDILGDLASFQAQSLRTTGLEIRHAFYGSRVMNSLMTNTNARDLIVRNVAANGNVLNGAASGMVFELGGITWWPAFFGFFVDDGGTARQFSTGSAGTYDQDHVVFTPEPDSSWYEFIEGTTPVNMDGASTSSDFSSAVAGIDIMQGMWQYAVRTNDPVGVKYIYGDNFFPSINVTGAVGICDTV